MTRDNRLIWHRVGATSGDGGDGGHTAILWTARFLPFATAPVFALMALTTALFNTGQANAICLAPGSSTPINDMVVMYMLMAGFHLSPWLRLVARRTRR